MATFTEMDELIVHQENHTVLKRFKCNECPAAFVSNSKLTRHQKTHTGEKLYKCDQCEISFNRKNWLQSHQRYIHGGPKPVVRQERSNVRERFMCDEKPFKSNRCMGSFTEMEKLMVKCKKCPAAFVSN